MNKLITHPGGMPFELDDIDFLYNALKEGFDGIAQGFAEDQGSNLILSGIIATVSATSAAVDISEGFIIFNNEICYMPSQTIAYDPTIGGGLTDSIYLDLVVSFDPNGLDVFADNNSKDTYEIRRVRANSNTQGIQFDAIKRLKTVIKEMALTPKSHTPTLDGNWVVENGDILRAKLYNDRVFLEGTISGGDTDTDICTLPSGYRPSLDFKHLVAMPATPYFVFLEIKSNGKVRADSFVTTASNGTVGAISLHGISFTI